MAERRETGREESNMSRNRKDQNRAGNWSISASIIAAMATMSLIAVFFAKPELVADGNTIVVTEGAIIPGIIVGMAFWLMVEMFTPPGKGIIVLLVRVVPAFTAGMFIGGIMGILFNFGRYLIIPIYYGNQGAMFDGFAIVVFGIATVWHAAWLHNKSYRGGKS